MGTDIHSRAEKRVNGKWQVIDGLHPFDWRCYGMFGFLANVRNYSAVPPLAEQRGLPDDIAANLDDLGDHSFTWLSVDEISSFDYDQTVEDRRVMRQEGPNLWNGGATAERGGGEMTTFREFLGPAFFDEIRKLQDAGAERVVFGFDS